MFPDYTQLIASTTDAALYIEKMNRLCALAESEEIRFHATVDHRRYWEITNTIKNETREIYSPNLIRSLYECNMRCEDIVLRSRLKAEESFREFKKRKVTI